MSENIKHISDASFEADVLKSELPVLVDFWAEWCGPCRSLTPIIEELAEEYEGKVVIGKCDVDQNNDLAMKFSVRNIPLVVFVKPGGQMNDKLVGAASKDAIKAKIDALL